MDKIQTCCICGGKALTIYSLEFTDIIGMADEYTQEIGFCPNCGYLFTQNPFSPEKLENRYKNESKFEFDFVTNVQNENKEYIARSKRNKNFIDECIGNINSIFEVGAASGYNLSLYSCERFGVEPSKNNCILAKRNYDVNMFNGTFQEYLDGNINSKYDLIYLGMVLEHIVDPHNFLSCCRKINNRYLFIEVPTLDIKNTDEPFGMFCEEHVSMFTFEALNNLLGSIGYGLVDARIEMGFDKGYPAGWPSLNTIWERGRRKINYIPSMDSKLVFDTYVKKNERALVSLQKRINDIPNDIPLAVWGTGHHVSMLLSNTSLAQKNIKKFYDSDNRKYRYTMLGKKITNFSLKDIETKEVCGIIIGSYIFQEEIEKKIINYGAKCPIFKLYEK